MPQYLEPSQTPTYLPPDSEPPEDPENDELLAKLRAGQNVRHHSRYQPSRLDRYAYELLHRHCGVDPLSKALIPPESAVVLQKWLLDQKQPIRASLSTVTRWLKSHQVEIDNIKRTYLSKPEPSEGDADKDVMTLEPISK